MRYKILLNKVKRCVLQHVEKRWNKFYEQPNPQIIYKASVEIIKEISHNP